MHLNWRHRFFGIVVAVLFSCDLANAELVSIDLVPGSGDQLLLHDTETGLDWLDVAQTANQNYDQVRTGAWYQVGFRHATIEQVRTLFLHAGVPDDGFDIPPTHPAEAAVLISLLGVTIVGDEGREGTWGFVGNDLFGNFITLTSHPLGQVFSALLGKVDHLPDIGEGHFSGGHPFSDEANPIWGSFLVRPNSWPQRDFFLHRDDSTNPPALTIDAVAPTATTAAFRDSGPVNFGGGNPWREIGTWSLLPVAPTETLEALTALHVWLGLKNSDDQGTRFDLRAEIYKADQLLTLAALRCVAGISRDPDKAMEIAVTFGSIAPVAVDTATEELKVKVLTRIGTNSNDTKCPGHNSAAGLRLYFDAASRPARFGAVAP